MMKRVFLLAVCFLAIGLPLAGCGGGGGGGTVVGDGGAGEQGGDGGGDGGGGSPPLGELGDFPALSERGLHVSPLFGVAIAQNRSTGSITVLRSEGSFDHATGGLTIESASGTLNDPNGFSGMIAEDGQTVLQRLPVSAGEDYTFRYEMRALVNGQWYDTTGIIGVAQEFEDWPRTGTATFTGDAWAVATVGVDGYDMTGGRSRVSADFAAKEVRIVLDNFQVTDQRTGKAVDGPIDVIEIPKAGLSYNRMHGGNVRLFKDGSEVKPFGSFRLRRVEGVFTGARADGTPDAAGGLVLIDGEEGVLAGGFVAD